MTEVRVTGAEQFKAISQALKEAGDKDLEKTFRKRVREPLLSLQKQELPASARSVLPGRGGLGERVARSKFRISQRRGVKSFGVRLTAINEYELRKMDDPGRVRHPTFFKNRMVRRGAFRRIRVERVNPAWVTQNITPGWFSTPVDTAAPSVREAVQKAMDDTLKEIERRT